MNIWFLQAHDKMHWTPEVLAAANTPALGGRIGGAEAMTIGLCRYLQRLGHDVTLWSTQVPTYDAVYAGLRWRRVERLFRLALLTEPHPDVIVSIRQPEVFGLPELVSSPSIRVLWAHDVLMEWQQPYLHLMDHAVFMSEWHRENYGIETPYTVSPVAYDPAWLPTEPVERPRTNFLYGSCPERGLQALLAMWPTIRQRVPGATLTVTGYQATFTEEASRWMAETHARVGGIRMARSDDKTGFYRELMGARLLLYPGVEFLETNGHVATAAVICGALPLLSRLGALPETCPAAMFFDGDAHSPLYQAAYIDAVVRWSQPEQDAELAERIQSHRDAASVACAFASVAALWDRMLMTLRRRHLEIAS